LSVPYEGHSTKGVGCTKLDINIFIALQIVYCINISSFVDTKKNKILLISYMRSGSTFTSEVLNQGGQVFFSFEPFWGVYRKMYRTNDKVCHRDGSCRYILLLNICFIL